MGIKALFSLFFFGRFVFAARAAKRKTSTWTSIWTAFSHNEPKEQRKYENSNFHIAFKQKLARRARGNSIDGDKTRDWINCHWIVFDI